ncbi:hypothetical protein FDI69_gp031 [Rhodococcus phage Trina]|uniref:Phage FDXHR zinc binding domain-containing protein n=1 Tax=Rhodococcus phage Trina TaxID=2027905 RepID=A0A2D0ZNC8_9CAUD|nr:hypothetical protein FDI69_gp031 [Rhodococcus phage Trina]ASZ74848.1 hypothetical protein SEA_TRINA_31 [Rhodococcus phage Trina]
MPKSTGTILVNSPRCECPRKACAEVFSNIRNFDKHRLYGKCVDPETVGLIIGKSGVWITEQERFKEDE